MKRTLRNKISLKMNRMKMIDVNNHCFPKMNRMNRRNQMNMIDRNQILLKKIALNCCLPMNKQMILFLLTNW
jgi:hypothetical protein